MTAPALFVYVQVKHQNIDTYQLSKNGYIQINPVENFTITFLDSDCTLTFEEENIHVLSVNEFVN